MVTNRSKVCFISHQLFTAGTFTDNVKNIEALAQELVAMGIVPIMPHALTTWINVDGGEADRPLALTICKAVILKCDFLVYDYTKKSKGVYEEIKFARSVEIPVHEIHFLRRHIEWLNLTTK